MESMLFTKNGSSTTKKQKMVSFWGRELKIGNSKLVYSNEDMKRENGKEDMLAGSLFQIIHCKTPNVSLKLFF